MAAKKFAQEVSKIASLGGYRIGLKWPNLILFSENISGRQVLLIKTIKKGSKNSLHWHFKPGSRMSPIIDEFLSVIIQGENLQRILLRFSGDESPSGLSVRRLATLQNVTYDGICLLEAGIISRSICLWLIMQVWVVTNLDFKLSQKKGFMTAFTAGPKPKCPNQTCFVIKRLKFLSKTLIV